MADEGWIEATGEGAGQAFAAGGRWVVADAEALDRRVAALALGAGLPSKTRLAAPRRVRLDCGKIDALDTVGAWLVLRLKAALARDGGEVSIDNLPARFVPLLDQARKYVPLSAARPLSGFGIVEAIARIGAWAIELGGEIRGIVGFFGLVVITGLGTLRHPRRIRPVAFISHVQRTGVSALPIVGLLCFLIGIVFAYQGADELRQFGAEIYTVNLLGIAFFRELGVLLAAIIVAGRSGSAFTAEIGTMQVNEEIDAMTTLGLDPIEVLVLPRLGALLLTLPLLTFYANVMGLVGGIVICNAVLGIPFPLFLEQLRSAIHGWTFWLGIIKAPFFALCIALVGCREGLHVARSAESVGRRTTSSVVESIFLVIVTDAAFSVLFDRLGI